MFAREDMFGHIRSARRLFAQQQQLKIDVDLP
jgi:hypothetical protein